MPSFLAHAVAPLALIPAFATPATPRRLWVLGSLCAMAPDVDVIGFRFGVAYADALGHRGLSHSLPTAAAVALLLCFAIWPRRRAPFSRAAAWLFLFLATASHGVLDTFTNGGLGVALLSPFDTERFFAPFRPIAVSPFDAGSFAQRALPILSSEALWIGLPCAALAGALGLLRRSLAPRAAAR
jgi:inner membrane protein